MQIKRLGMAVAALGLLAACDDDDSNRFAGAGVGAGGASGFQDRIGGLRTEDPGAVVIQVGDITGDNRPDYAIGEGRAANGGRVTIRSGLTQTLALTAQSTADPASFGSAVASASDIDRDGRNDLLVGAPDAVGGGAVFVVSSRDGSTILQIPTTSSSDLRFGSSVYAQDANGDGIEDYYIAFSGRSAAFGGATLLSGSDPSTELGAISFGSTGPSPTGLGPSGLIPLGDYDADGVNDVFLSNDGESSLIVSGRTLRLIRSHPGRSASATVLGDFDGDAVGEYAIGYPNRNDQRGQVEIFSGATGRRLLVLEGPRAEGEFGHSIAFLSDRDGDDVRDFVVGGRGYLRAYSGATRLPIGEQNADDANDVVRITSLNDLNGDGVIDYAVATGQDVIIYSGVPMPLSADQFEISVGSGGIQRFALDLGPEHAGRTYHLIGSFTGVAPGTDVGNGFRLPITLDPYSNHTATLVPSDGFVGFTGLLDSNGRAEAQLAELRVLPPGLIGLQLYHAGLVLQNRIAVATTNSVAVTFVR